jgi:hypothetical protein
LDYVISRVPGEAFGLTACCWDNKHIRIPAVFARESNPLTVCREVRVGLGALGGCEADCSASRAADRPYVVGVDEGDLSIAHVGLAEEAGLGGGGGCRKGGD